MKPRLLLVDDHAGFRSFARALLEAEGYSVVGEAADGASAIRGAERLAPEIVLLDVILPDLDGFEVCERITGKGARPIAVVLTSSRDPAAYRDRLARSSARGFIAKEDLTGAALAALTG
ncbi:response regulator transcription factor [Streptomyces sp. NPDC056464]|uniref:response regulator n=1 Tax=Streptomyces sp. NPDC056464 TaxID=3345828 RepID=UPI0036A4F83B